jgi:hypothetical protein
MEINCARAGVYVQKGESTVELRKGLNTVPDALGNKLLGKTFVTQVTEEKLDEEPEEKLDEASKPAVKKEANNKGK